MRASAELDAFIDESISRSQRKGYHPTTFISMRDRHGTIEAISRLVISGDIQSGFKRLVELEMKDWTIEQAVMKFPTKFLPAIREAAEWRLHRAEIEAAGKN